MEIKPFHYGRAFPHQRVGDVAGALTDDLLAQVAGLRAELDAQRCAAETDVIEAQREGFDKGLRQGRDEAGSALLAAVDALHAGLEELGGRLSDHVRGIARDAAQTALAAADLLAGHALLAAPVRTVEEALRRIVADLARGTTIVVHVHPSMLDPLNDCLTALANRDRRKLSVTLLPDEAIPPGDGRIDWGAGGVVLDAAMRRAHVLGELRSFLSGPDKAGDEADKVAGSANHDPDKLL